MLRSQCNDWVFLNDVQQTVTLDIVHDGATKGKNILGLKNSELMARVETIFNSPSQTMETLTDAGDYIMQAFSGPSAV